MTRTQSWIVAVSALTIATLLTAILAGWFYLGPTLAARYLAYDFDLIAASGTIGDSFGPLNALFAAFGFLAVMVTLIIQGFSIRNQQKEIGRAQADLHRQRFESSFFQLLDLMRQVRAEIVYTTTTKTKNGRLVGGRALKGAYEDAKHLLIRETPIDRKLSKTEIAKLYKGHIHIRSEDGLGPYFRLIYTILRRIHQDSVLTEEEKVQYGNLLRGQLGSPEVALLVLNGLTKDSRDLSEYLNRFRIPRYLPDSSVRRSVKEFYTPTAFEPRGD
ncbi:putative phage abortive infection protein [Ensifer sp. 1H6]|uniref:putative phage abortive infection protein n=1 Tax=Ensifer sp. 1H6 TaxID=1911585 RepID=UPI0009D4BD19|nr:putative phage abortive infection protein [Ensifer sp. 1H6]OMQ42059.1 hypothetical protein BKP54_25300 [Ensifer sp. 1H6]